MNTRRALPLSSLAVFNSSAFTSWVSSILVPPKKLFLAQYTILGQFSFRKSLRAMLREKPDHDKYLRSHIGRFSHHSTGLKGALVIVTAGICKPSVARSHGGEENLLS